MKVYLIGAGLGGGATLTCEAKAAIDECPVLVGAPRLLEPYPGKRRVPAVLAGDVAAAVHAQEDGPVAVLLSGDVGFYSGAKNLYPLLEDCELAVLPGLSSLVCFCARLRTPWEDVFCVSAHGRAHNAAGEIQRHKKTFVLTGGRTKAEDICRELDERGLGALRVSAGERLGCPDERVVTASARELAGERFCDLTVLLVWNPRPIERPWSAPGLPDSAFTRGGVPMTKEEIRALAIAKLRLAPAHVLWDVGAGTGSVSVEGAYAVPAGRVYAVERKPEAVALLKENREKFGLGNLTVVPGEAPGALAGLPAPDRVFLGGTAGRMEDILRAALEKNPSVRAVAAAVTLETIAETLRCFAALSFSEPEIVQLAATRVKRAGAYHLLDAQNPVWLVSASGGGGAA